MKDQPEAEVKNMSPTLPKSLFCLRRGLKKSMRKDQGIFSKLISDSRGQPA